MTTMTLQVPEELEKDHDETVRFLASKLYEAKKLSLGQAAEMCHVTKADFPSILAKYGVDYFQYDYNDIMRDLDRMNG